MPTRQQVSPQGTRQLTPAKVWRMRPPPPAGFSSALGLPPFQAHLLYNRGIRRREDLESYLAADSRLANDPMLLPDMDRAVARLRRALTDGEVIGIFGDFDTDGLTATALLVRAFGELGASVVPYLPNRVDEGHGLNNDAVERLKAQQVSLMVTVDCGVSSVPEVALASSIGIDTIITDHHSIPATLPSAEAIVDPRRSDYRYPYDGLTGAGLAFKLAEGLWAALGRERPEHLLELAALGTVADVGPLTGENRHIVKWGLERLNQTQLAGIKALVARARLSLGSLDTESLSFGLIPRLNAAGRLGDATVSLQLLTAQDVHKAEPLAEALELRNDERRMLSEEGVAQAMRQIEPLLSDLPPMLIVEHDRWQPGILGLIAGNLSEAFYRPAVAILTSGGLSRGSARSIPEFDVVDALRTSHAPFQRFGGHPQAAGFTLKTSDLGTLKRDLVAIAREKLDGQELTPAIEIDCEISPALLSEQTYRFIESLSPFGEKNPAPVFLTRNARVAEARKVGKGGNHLKMRVIHSGMAWDTIAFRQADSMPAQGDKIDLVYTAGLDNWGGQPTLQLNVLDFRVRR